MTKRSRLGLGVALGAALGAVAGVLFAPKSGSETRRELKTGAEKLQKKIKSGSLERDVKKIFGKVTDQTKKKYRSIQSDLERRVAEVRRRGAKIDRTKYVQLVDEVVSSFKKASKESAKTATKLKNHLAHDSKNLVAGLKKPNSTKKK